MQRCLSLLIVCVILLGSSATQAGPVNINTADAETLAQELTGVGSVLAAEIIRDRDQNGPYESPESLTRVKGVGPRIVEMNRDYILIADERESN